jgi:hypothetical protein
MAQRYRRKIEISRVPRRIKIEMYCIGHVRHLLKRRAGVKARTEGQAEGARNRLSPAALLRAFDVEILKRHWVMSV